jgi:hypothetical protein
MEEYSYNDEYFANHDDGSSFRTSLTPYSIDPSMATRTGMKIRREWLFFESLENASRMSCDALWWLITEPSSPDERQHQTMKNSPKRNHKLRIVGKDDQRSSHPIETLPSNRYHPPIKWKSKGKSANPSLQSTSSSGSLSVSSSAKIAGDEGKGDSGDGHTTFQQYDPATVSNGQGAELTLTFEAGNSDTSGNSKSGFSKELQTVDSRILLRKRQKGKVKDVIRFKNLNNPEIINGGPSKGIRTTDSGQQQSKSQLTRKGLPPLPPRQSSSKNSSGTRSSNACVVGKNLDSRDAFNGSILPDTQEVTVPPNKKETVDEVPKACENGRASFWQNLSKGKERESPHLPRSLDGMEVAQKPNPGRHLHTLLQEFSSEKRIDYAEERDTTSPPSFSTKGDLVHKWATNTPKIEVAASRGGEGEIDPSCALPLKMECSSDESVCPFIEQSELISSFDASTGCKDTIHCLSRIDANPKISSSISVRSFNSAHSAKDAWLQSRPTFEGDDGDHSLEKWVQRNVNKPRKSFVKRHTATPLKGGSVASLDRIVFRRHIQPRQDDETMSVY